MADPYPIGGKIYDIAGTAIANATTTVIAIDVTKSLTSGTRVMTSSMTDPVDGSYAVDLSTLKDKDGEGSSVDYADSDKIQIIAYDENTRYSAGERHTVDISAGAPAIDIYLHVGPPHLATCRYMGGFASNSHSSATYFHIYDIERDELVARIDVAANTTAPLPVGIGGVKIKGGMCIVYTGDTTNTYVNFVRSVK